MPTTSTASIHRSSLMTGRPQLVECGPVGASASSLGLSGSPQFGYQSQLTDLTVGLQYLRPRRRR